MIVECSLFFSCTGVQIVLTYILALTIDNKDGLGWVGRVGELWPSWIWTLCNRRLVFWLHVWVQVKCVSLSADDEGGGGDTDLHLLTTTSGFTRFYMAVFYGFVFTECVCVFWLFSLFFLFYCTCLWSSLCSVFLRDSVDFFFFLFLSLSNVLKATVCYKEVERSSFSALVSSCSSCLADTHIHPQQYHTPSSYAFLSIFCKQ